MTSSLSFELKNPIREIVKETDSTQKTQPGKYNITKARFVRTLSYAEDRPAGLTAKYKNY
jgi:hypothetical protein